MAANNLNFNQFKMLNSKMTVCSACCTTSAVLLHRRPPETSLLQPPDAVGSPRSVDGAPTAVQTCGVCVVVAVLRTPRVFAVGWAVSHHYKTVLFDLLRLGPDSGARRRRVADAICVNDQKQPAAQAHDASASEKCGG